MESYLKPMLKIITFGRGFTVKKVKLEALCCNYGIINEGMKSKRTNNSKINSQKSMVGSGKSR